MSMLDSAIVFAVKAHARQTRKSKRGDVSLPFVVHPIEVLKMLFNWGTIDPVVAVAAVLHDVLEDTETSPQELHCLFGVEVARIVVELTLSPGSNKAAYLEDFKEPRLKSPEALVIKVADRICNVRDFMLTDVRYAHKYFNKANCLGHAMQDRYDEISLRWGTLAYQSMFRTWALLEETTEAALWPEEK